MKVLFINNDGGGYADRIDVAEGTTVTQLFAQKMGESAKADDYKIRVNREPTTSDQVLHDGDRCSITPTKIDGGH